MFYRMTPYYEKNALFVTIDAVSDLVRVYGTGILQGETGNNAATSETSTMNSTSARQGGRRLYNADCHAEFEVDNIEEVTFKDVVDILADILDDEVKSLYLFNSIKIKCEE